VDVSSLRSGVIHLKWQESDLAALVREAATRAASDAQSTGVSLDLDDGDGSFVAWVDPKRMGQVLDSLLYDALSHSPRNSAVAVRLREVDADWIELEIADASGRSADAALFQPFARIDPEPQGRRGDLGLGLPLAQRLVMAHGGLLKAASHARGLVLTVLLPRENVTALPGVSEPAPSSLAA
jgi:two-component system OmpR family sensor kinase